MLRKLLLISLIVAAAGSALAASADPLSLLSFIPAVPFAEIGVGRAAREPDSFAMVLACLGVMGLIARRRFR